MTDVQRKCVVGCFKSFIVNAYVFKEIVVFVCFVLSNSFEESVSYEHNGASWIL